MNALGYASWRLLWERAHVHRHCRIIWSCPTLGCWATERGSRLWEAANGWFIVQWPTLRRLKAVKAKSKQTKSSGKWTAKSFLFKIFFGGEQNLLLPWSQVKSVAHWWWEMRKKCNETKRQMSFNCVQMICWFRTNSGGTSEQMSVHGPAKIKYAVFGRHLCSKFYINSNQTWFSY